MVDLVRIGSETAKGGFANEKIISEKFENWRKDKEAQKWLKTMGYELKKNDILPTLKVCLRANRLRRVGFPKITPARDVFFDYGCIRQQHLVGQTQQMPRTFHDSRDVLLDISIWL